MNKAFDKGWLTQIAPDLAKTARKMIVLGGESRFSNGGALQTRQAGNKLLG